MRGRIVAIEGGDGAGKGTVARALQERLSADGYRAALASFPRYAETLAGRAIGDFLAHRTPAPQDPRAVAVFYAADRLESKSFLKNLCDNNDWVVIDRYVASNMAYQASKVAPVDSLEVAEWIEKLEFDTFSLPRPSLCVFMDMPVEVAQDLILRKSSRSYTDMARDLHEDDLNLQKSVSEAYRSFVRAQMVSSWLVVKPYADGLRPPADLADQIAGHLRDLDTSPKAERGPR